MDKLHENLLKEFNEIKSRNLSLNMSRGKPSSEQLDFSNGLLNFDISPITSDNVDIRNYGELTGLKSARELFASLFDVSPNNVIVYGASSLNIMYDYIARSMTHGVSGSTPWAKLDKVKWICPTPGYDRHFSICEYFGIEMVSVPMNDDGPDMDMVEELVKVPSVKGIWCVPQYSNPTGVTYSDEVVKRFARLKPAAKDFRIYWDNAYFNHHLDFNHQDHVLNIFDECKKVASEDMVYEFASFSKISFAGASIAAAMMSDKNLAEVKKQLSYQTIGFDKVNQARHVAYFKNKDGVISHMKKHAELLKPKFDLVDSILSEEVSGLCSWTRPNGGYFISLYVPNKAKEVYQRCKEMGLTLTDVGAAFPYHKDPTNSHIRIAPTYLSLVELKEACHILTLAIQLETK